MGGLSKTLKKIADPAGMFSGGAKNFVAANLDPLGSILRTQSGTATNLQGLLDPYSLYKANPAGGGSQGSGTASINASGVPTGSPSYPGFTPNPFLQTPGLGDFSKLAFSMMGPVPPSGALGSPVPPVPGTPASPGAPGTPTVGGQTVLQTAPGSGAYRPGFNQQLLQPAGRMQIPYGLLSGRQYLR